MARPITLSTVVPLIAIPGQESALSAVLASLQPKALEEVETYQWYATRITSPAPAPPSASNPNTTPSPTPTPTPPSASNSTPAPSFIVFDTFPTHSAREAHFKGDIPKTLIGYGGTLLAGRPEHGKILTEVVGAKVGRVDGRDGRGEGEEQGEGDVDLKAGLEVGLKVEFEAREGKEEDVRKFLSDAVSLARTEQQTISFYALHWPGTHKFGIIDFFASEAGRKAHLGGEI
ncbi:hypothetical protein CVT26_014293, partial [Gymnopilus dilepis]